MYVKIHGLIGNALHSDESLRQRKRKGRVCREIFMCGKDINSKSKKKKKKEDYPNTKLPVDLSTF